MVEICFHLVVFSCALVTYILAQEIPVDRALDVVQSSLFPYYFLRDFTAIFHFIFYWLITYAIWKRITRGGLE